MDDWGNFIANALAGGIVGCLLTLLAWPLRKSLRLYGNPWASTISYVFVSLLSALACCIIFYISFFVGCGSVFGIDFIDSATPDYLFLYLSKIFNNDMIVMGFIFSILTQGTTIWVECVFLSKDSDPIIFGESTLQCTQRVSLLFWTSCCFWTTVFTALTSTPFIFTTIICRMLSSIVMKKLGDDKLPIFFVVTSVSTITLVPLAYLSGLK